MKNDPITKHDALRWLEMQRDAINTEIAYAAPSDKNQYFGNLRVVNWIADRVKDMTAVEYLEALNEAWREKGIVGKKARAAIRMHTLRPRQAVEIVKRWKEEQDGSAQTKS